LIKKNALEDIELTQEDMVKISYLQLKTVREEKGRVKERIRLLESSLHFGCDEAYGALAELLKDNFDSLSHHNRMHVLSILEKSKRRWLIYILTKYQKNSSRLIRDATNNAMNKEPKR
jgi:hypothetical protein